MEKRITFRGNLPGASAADPVRSQLRERIFLLSPANLKGARAQRLRRGEPVSELSTRMRAGGVTVAELFSVSDQQAPLDGDRAGRGRRRWQSFHGRPTGENAA
jgi:hypothetical protein